MIRTRLTSVASAAIVLVALAACSNGGSSDSSQPSAGATGCPGGTGGRTNLVATSLSALAPAFVTVDGKPAGYAYDLETAVAKELGCEITFQEAAFAATIPGVQSGKFDIGSVVSPSPDREKVVDVVAMWSGSYTFVQLKGSTQVIGQASDLCGLRLTVATGAVFLPFLKEFETQCATVGKPLQIIESADQASAQLAVKSGRADLATTGTTQGQSIQKDDPALAPVKFVFGVTYSGVALKKGGPLTQKWAEATNRLIANGTYGKIFDKYGPDKAIKQVLVNFVPTPSPSAT